MHFPPWLSSVELLGGGRPPHSSGAPNCRGWGGIESFRLGSPRRGEGCGERARTAAARNPRGPAAAAEANLDPPPPTARRERMAAVVRAITAGRRERADGAVQESAALQAAWTHSPERRRATLCFCTHVVVVTVSLDTTI